MGKRKYYSIILIILLITVMALAQGETTSPDSDKVNKSGDTMTGTLVLPTMQSPGTLLFTNISFNFQQLKARYWAFGHPTDMWVSDTMNFSFFTDINLNGNNIIDCGNCDTSNLKVNKSGEIDTLNLSSKIKIHSPVINGLDLNYSFESIYNGTTRTFLYAKYGIQEWKLNDTGKEVGWITYSTPFASPGIVFYNNSTTRLNRTDVRSGYDSRMNLDGLIFAVGKSASARFADVAIKRETGEVYVYNLTGTGNAYACVDEAGKIYRGTPTC